MEAHGGTLMPRRLVDGSKGGSISALNSAGMSGIILLDARRVWAGQWRPTRQTHPRWSR
jgi:hypothetical protein